MANRVIKLESTETVISSLEVYRDISMVADLNQANILKSYNEIIPMAYLAKYKNDKVEATSLTTNETITIPNSEIREYVQGEISALDVVKKGFNIMMQLSDAYYEEVYGADLDSFTLFLATETSKTLIKTEDSDAYIILLKNAGDVSSYNNWKEALQWNPYKLSKLVNVKAVFNSIDNIFKWTPGERILNPEFGSNLKHMLYNGITDITYEQITAEIRRCIGEFEPRVSINRIVNVSTINDIEENTIQLDIEFTIPSLSREQFLYSYKYKLHTDEYV